MSWDQTTTRRPDTAQSQADRQDVNAALTIACHPDLDRIGERALLPELAAGRDVPVSRTEPDFAPPGAVWGRPLEDPFLSRRPLFLRPARDDGILLDSADHANRVTVDGQPCAAPRRLSDSEVREGVVLELAQRVVLLVHGWSETDHPPAGPLPDGDMVGASGPMMQVRHAIDQVAGLEVPVLLRGETGTGKELVARALHRQSRRADDPFVAVNLGALPPSLAAAELFGSVKGAFTGAVSHQSGYFRAAQGGTLFLDEVGETPAEVQAMLLRVLETGEVFPVGSQRAHQVDVRLVAATDADLEARVRDGSFREPLLHRLSTYEISLPPLRRRRDDIGRLFLHFAGLELAALGEDGPPRGRAPGAPPWWPAELAVRLLRYAWPGNVRQLHNVVRQLVIDSRGRDRLVAGPRLERLLAASETASASSKTADEAAEPPPRRRPAEIRPSELEAALRAFHYEPAAAARALGIPRPSVYYLIRQHPGLRTAEDLDAAEIRRVLGEVGGEVTAAAEQLEVSARALRRRLKKLGE